MRAAVFAASLFVALLALASGLSVAPAEGKPSKEERQALQQERKRLKEEKAQQKKEERRQRRREGKLHKEQPKEEEMAQRAQQQKPEQEALAEQPQVQEQQKLEKQKQERFSEQQRLEKLEQERAANRAICKRISYIRTQRTAGATFGDVILPKMTSENNQTFVKAVHMEHRWAKSLAPDCVVATLRDPVERLMSEYSMLRGNDGEAMEHDEWDVHSNDLPWLRETRSLPFGKGLETYLTKIENPGWNRQARYLLGFERVGCDGRCCGVCSKGEAGYPAHSHEFFWYSDDLIAQAKQRLQSLKAFAVADCFPESMRALATSVGWDPDETEKLARAHHLNQRRNATCLGEYCTVFTKDFSSLERQYGEGNVKWTATLPFIVWQGLRDNNRVDVELVAFAKQLLYERHGIKCGL